jgi:lipopolysaccharide assembly protein B
VPEISLITWAVGITALVVGILAGHFGWGKRWPTRSSKLHPDYLAGLHYLVTEQPDRALDMFLKLMDANADTLETHFALGSLYRRRGEVERAIRIHQNLLARPALAPEHREQALLALAQDYLRAGLLDRAEGLFQQVSEVPRLRASALDSLRGVYERQHEWRQALEVYRQLERIKAAPPRLVAAHYLCELAASALERGETDAARDLLREARREVARFPRAAVLRSQIAEDAHDTELAIRLMRTALREAPQLLQEQLPRLLRLVGPQRHDALLAELAKQAEARDLGELKRLVFAALSAGFADSGPLSEPIKTVFAADSTLQDLWQNDLRRVAHEIGALLKHAEKYRCSECGFSGGNFYWHCPACHAWDSFEAYAIVKLG